jgi:hypothetical protein
MTGNPSNEPTGYERQRVASFRPVAEAVEKLGLPMIRGRKLRTICNAIEMQIEDGGDSLAVNELLLAALRAGVLHQVGEHGAEPVLRAIERFQRSESQRLARLASGASLPPDPEARQDDLELLREILIESGQREQPARWENQDISAPTHPRLASPTAESTPGPPPGRAVKLGRNDPCWCGSGKKYKRCHLAADQV